MWGLEINGIEQIGKAISASANNQLDRQNNTFNVTCKDIDETYHFLECNLSIDDVDVATGIVISQTFKESGYKKTTISCTDHYYIFQHRIVIEQYEYMTVSDILIDLITKYAPEFSTEHIDSTVNTIDYFDCNYILLSEAITKLVAYLTDYHYYIDANRSFHLFEDYEEDGIRFEKDTTTGKFNFLNDSLDVSYDATNVVNRVWVIGAKQAAENSITQYYTGDGLQRYFSFAYEPNYVEIYVDDVLMNSLNDSNDDGSQDFLISKTNWTFYIPDNIETPFTGTVKTVYKPTVQAIDYFESNYNDNPYLLEKVIKNKDVTEKMVVRSYGKAEIMRQRSIKTKIKLKTYDNVWIGQRCFVQIDDYSINAYFLVTQVNMSFRNDGKVLSTITMEEI